MSVCLANIGTDVYAFVGSSGVVQVYLLNTQNPTTFNGISATYNITLSNPQGPLSSINLCAVANNQLFILGGFGGSPAIILLNLGTTSTPEPDFSPFIVPIKPSNPSTFLATTTSFTVFAGTNLNCVFFSGGNDLSDACFNAGGIIPLLSVEDNHNASAGSILAVATGELSSNNTGILYDMVNDKVQIYDLSLLAEKPNLEFSSALTVKNPVNATGQLYPVSNDISTTFRALFSVGNALYYVAQNTTKKTSGNRGANAVPVGPVGTTGGNNEVSISHLNPALPMRSSQYAYLYANERVFFADASAGGSYDLDSLIQSSSTSSSAPANPSRAVPGQADPSTSVPATESASNNTGAIVGGVVGGVVALAIIIALLLWYHRRKRRQPKSYSIGAENEKLSSGDLPQKQAPLDNDTNYDTIIIPATEIKALDPLSTASAAVFGGAYHILQGEQAILVSPSGTRIQNYAMRTITNRHGEVFSLHYFGAESRAPFLRDVAVTRAIGQSNAVVRTVEAFQSQAPIHSNAGVFQYMWITSPATIPTQSLDYLLQSPGLFDVSDAAFLAWSTLTLLEAVRDLHGAGYVHLDLRPIHFYYPDPDQVDRWKLAGFESAVKTNSEIGRIGPNAYQAPELTNPHVRADPRSDIWSLGWVVFYLITGEGPQPDERAAIDRAHQVDNTYGTLLGHMLQRDPSGRFSARQLADYWKEAQNMEDDT